jgi:hypothetical protein
VQGSGSLFKVIFASLVFFLLFKILVMLALALALIYTVKFFMR